MKCIKLTYKSPLHGSVYCEGLQNGNDNCVVFGPYGVLSMYNKGEDVLMFMTENMEDLAPYVPESLRSLIVSAVFGKIDECNGGIYLLTEIFVTQEPTDIQYRQISQWICGQLSDGWGEHLEQTEVMSETVTFTQTVFDEDTFEFSDEETRYTASYYIRPWADDSSWWLNLDSNETVEINIKQQQSNPSVQCATCELQPNGEYHVRTVYKFDTKQDVLNAIKNSGMCYCTEFTNWIENFGTFGNNIRLYAVCVGGGLFCKFLDMLGVMDDTCERARLFILDAETGEIELEEYGEQEHKDFYTDLLTK